jgi:hypothetical protein
VAGPPGLLSRRQRILAWTLGLGLGVFCLPAAVRWTARGWVAAWAGLAGFGLFAIPVIVAILLRGATRSAADESDSQRGEDLIVRGILIWIAVAVSILILWRQFPEVFAGKGI